MRYIFHILLSLSFVINSQTSHTPPYISPSTIIPVTIYSTSPVKIVTNILTAHWTDRVSKNYTLDIANNNVYLENCVGYKYNNILLQPREFIDTFKIGTLNPGIYTAYFKSTISNGIASCNTLTFSSTSFTFQVTDATPIDVSVSETNLHETQIQFFPNPFDEEVDLQLNGFVQYPSKLSITNSLGQMIYQETVLSDKLKLQTNFIPKGIYYLEIEDGVQTKRVKLVKN